MTDSSTDDLEIKDVVIIDPSGVIDKCNEFHDQLSSDNVE